MHKRELIQSVFAMVMLMCLCVASAGADEKVLYRLKLKEGQKYYLKMVVEEEITETVAGVEETILQTTSMGTDFDVNEVDENGNAWVRYTLRWTGMRHKTPTMEVKYDSTDKETPVPPMATGLVALLGESYYAKLSPDGSVIGMKDVDKMLSNILKKYAFAPMQDQLKREIEQFVGEKALRENIEMDMCVYPPMPVGIGDSWNRLANISQGTPMILEDEWTLKERKDGVAIIELVTDIKPDTTPVEMGAVRVTYEFSGKQTGVIEMDESTGMVIRAKMNRNLSGITKMESGGSGQGQMTMTTPVKITGVTNFEVTKREKDSPARKGVAENI